MRIRIFRWLLGRLERHTPGWAAGLQLQILLLATARAFDKKGKMIWYKPPGKALAAYADFTVDCMKAGGYDPKRIYAVSFRLGRLIRRLTGVGSQGASRDDAQRLVFYLYRNIGIDMRGQLPGEIIVSDCYFGQRYTPGQCALMSMMDWGVIAGICGGGKLVFTERITQGCGRCRACLSERRCDR